MRHAFLSLAVIACCCARLLAREAETIAGTILDREGAPVAGALVIVCDSDTGMPVGRDFAPFAHGMEVREIACVASDVDGRFSFPDAKPGTYQLLAQSWEDASRPATKPLEVNGRVVRLRGLAERVVVPSEEARQITLRPCGTATLDVTADPLPGNDDTLLVVSRRPLAADPILGFASWSGAFMPGMVAANRMPKGRTTFRDMPDGSVYLAAFANDNSPGFGGAACGLRADRSVGSVVPLIAAWSDGHKDPPATLVELVAKLRTIPRDTLRELVEQQYPDLARSMDAAAGQPRDPWTPLIPYLDKPVTLPDGASVPLKEAWAAEGYMRLGDDARVRRKK